MCRTKLILDCCLCVQTKEGKPVGGLGGMEYQELTQFCKLPEMQAAAEKHFRIGANDWFDRDVDKKLQLIKSMLSWNTRELGEFFMVLEDHDRRHTFNDIALFIETRSLQDRTLLPASHPRAIHFNKVMRLVPSTQRVPDCLQQPIECVYSTVKPQLLKQIAAHGKASTETVAEIVLDVVPRVVTRELVSACWRHATTAIQVFAGTQDEFIMVQNKRTGKRTYKVFCTHGNWVPKLVAG